LFSKDIKIIFFIIYIDAVEFSKFFNNQIKRLTTVLYNYQHNEKNDPINDPDKFVKITTLTGFFDMLFQSMNPLSKNSITKENLKRMSI